MGLYLCSSSLGCTLKVSTLYVCYYLIKIEIKENKNYNGGGEELKWFSIALRVKSKILIVVYK